MFVEERRRVILEQLKQHGRVSVKALSELMNVSAVTIRQDLRALEDVGLLERTYGGAVTRESGALPPELSFHVRLGKRRAEKQAIAAAAAELLEDGCSLALDASTTAYALIPHIKNLKRVTVITNSLIIAQNFLDSPHVQVLIPGGRLRRDSISTVGQPDGLPDIHLNVGFFGARGISLVGGCTEIDPDEVAMKSAMIGRCVRTVMLVDASKWGQVAPYTFLKPEKILHIISSDEAPADLVEAFREHGTRIELVSAE
jgi:DeoR/GlpR family transcriptional regulator of sugar metabolism